MTDPSYTNHAPGLTGEMLKPVEHVQKDLVLRAASLGASTSVAVSGVARVRRLEGPKSQVSEIAIACGSSGVGKSLHLEFALSPIEDHIAHVRHDMSQDQLHQDIKMRVWRKKLSATERMMTRDYDGTHSTVQAHEAHLLSLYAEKPTVPANPDIIYRDTTIQAILHGANNFPIVGLLDDEGGRMLGMLRSKDFHSLASAWDGRPLVHNRAQGGRMEVQMVLTLLLCLQPDVYIAFLAKQGKLLKASGLLARLLHFWVDKNWAAEDVKHADLNSDNKVYARYVARVQDVLDEAMQNARMGLDRIPVKEFSSDAKTKLQELRRQYHEMMGDPAYAECVDFLAKMVDHVTRMAAKWHIFEGREGNISAEYVEAAGQVLRYHLDVFRLLHGQPARERLEIMDAEHLLDVIRDAGRTSPPTRGELMNLAFNAGISTSARFGNALGLLGKERKVEITRRGNVRLPHNLSRPQEMPSRWIGRFD